MRLLATALEGDFLSAWWDHFKDRVGNTPITYDPFPHMHVGNVFPDEFYRKLLEHRFRVKLQMLDPNRPERRIGDLKADDESEFIAEFATVLLGDEFRINIAYMFGVSAGVKAEAQMLCDVPGYKLGVHTDIPTKIMTGLFYLPHTSSGAEYGTGLYISKSGYEDNGFGEHEPGGDFERVKLIPFVPNTALFFPRLNWSYHAVERSEIDRWLISYDILA